MIDREVTVANYSRSMNRLLSVLVMAMGVFALYWARVFIIPFVVALILFFILINFENIITKLAKKTFPPIARVSALLSVIIFIVLLFVSSRIITSNFDEMLSNSARYQMLFNGKIVQINKGIKEMQIMSMVPEEHIPFVDSKLIENINFINIFNRISGFATRGITNFALVLVYLIFLYGERKNFRKKICKIRENYPNSEKIISIVTRIGRDLVKYFNIKTVVSFITAALSYPVMVAFGLEFVWLWTFAIFIFNYIPTIGSIIATLLPAILGILMFDSIVDALFMALIMTGIQFTIGNIIEPKFQGDRLNLAPLIILLSLAVWGAIWGVVGMFLAVPIMVTINAALSQFRTTRPLAMFFSSSGEIKD